MTAEPVLLDLGAVPACHCDDALDHLHKAIAEDPHGEPESIWRPHENPWLTEHVEDWTSRMQALLVAIQDTLARALTGQPLGELAKAEPWMRWDAEAFAATRTYLEGKLPASYSLDDWMMLVDFLIQRYLPEGVIQSEAEYLTVRAALAGKVAANMEAQAELRAKLTPKLIPALVKMLPTRFAHIAERVLTPMETAVLRCAHSRAAVNISAVADRTRSRMKGVILEHVQAMVLGQKEGTTEYLRTRLFDEFGVLNRDMRRIAISEAGECQSQGFIAAQPAGQKLKRMEAYNGACPWCRDINGAVVAVVDPAEPNKDGMTEIWLGKTNIGRSVAPRKRIGGELVPREPHEMWWIAAGIQHPHCRGSWTPVSDRPANVSPEFDRWLKSKLQTASKTQG